MPNTIIPIGLCLFFAGMIPWTIGVFISFVTNYDVHNRNIRAGFDPKRLEPNEQVSSREVIDAYFDNPKSKWWCRIGFGISAVGMVLLVIAALRLKIS
jgi:hypothetical protein